MKAKYRRLTTICIAVIAMAIALVVMLNNLRQHLIFFYSPTELNEASVKPSATIRVGGLVKEESIEKNSHHITFVLTDKANELTISYTGLLPDLFREGQGIVARGKLIEKNHLKADQLLAKHDENYMPKEVVDSLKATGHWKDEE